MKNKYRVVISTQTFHTFEVEAEDEYDAQRKVLSGQWEPSKSEDGNDFYFESIEMSEGNEYELA